MLQKIVSLVSDGQTNLKARKRQSWPAFLVLPLGSTLSKNSNRYQEILSALSSEQQDKMNGSSADSTGACVIKFVPVPLSFYLYLSDTLSSTFQEYNSFPPTVILNVLSPPVGIIFLAFFQSYIFFTVLR